MLLSVLALWLIHGYVQSAPTPQFPQQNSIFPGYFYQQFPFIYNPYPNPFYSYNYHPEISSSQYKGPELRTSDERFIPSGKPLSISIPLIPVIQYVPAYGGHINSWSANEIPVTVVFDEHRAPPATESAHSSAENKIENPPEDGRDGIIDIKFASAPKANDSSISNNTISNGTESSSPSNSTASGPFQKEGEAPKEAEKQKESEDSSSMNKNIDVYAPQYSDVPYYAYVSQESASPLGQNEISVSPLVADGKPETAQDKVIEKIKHSLQENMTSSPEAEIYSQNV